MCFSEILLSITFTSFYLVGGTTLAYSAGLSLRLFSDQTRCIKSMNPWTVHNPIFLVAENHWKIQKNDTWGEKLTSRPSPKKISSLLFPATKPAWSSVRSAVGDLKLLVKPPGSCETRSGLGTTNECWYIISFFVDTCRYFCLFSGFVLDLRIGSCWYKFHLEGIEQSFSSSTYFAIPHLPRKRFLDSPWKKIIGVLCVHFGKANQKVVNSKVLWAQVVPLPILATCFHPNFWRSKVFALC